MTTQTSLAFEMTDETQTAATQPDLTTFDLILINSSAGKDSQAMLDLVVEFADAAGVRDRLVVVHCDLGRIEWEGTAELAERQAAHYGLRFIKVSRPQGDLLQHIEARGMFPSNTARYCTSDHKRGQVERAMTSLVREALMALGKKRARVLNCLGLRAQESPARAKRVALELSTRSNGRREVWTWLPILDCEKGQEEALLAGLPAMAEQTYESTDVDLIKQALELRELAPGLQLVKLHDSGELTVELESTCYYGENYHWTIHSRFGAADTRLDHRPADARAALAAIIEQMGKATAAIMAKREKKEQAKAQRGQEIRDEAAAWARKPLHERVEARGVINTDGLSYDARQELEALEPAAVAEAKAEAKRLYVARREAEAAKERVAKAQVSAAERMMVAAHAPMSLRRWEEQLMPEAELLELARNVLFSPFNDFPRYKRLTKKDLDSRPSSGPCADAEAYTSDKHLDVSFDTEDEGTLSAEQYKVLESLREVVAKTFTIILRWHIACCSCSRVIRPSALIQIEWAGRELSREYSLDLED